MCRRDLFLASLTMNRLPSMRLPALRPPVISPENRLQTPGDPDSRRSSFSRPVAMGQ